jgi:hypothetical protein
MARCILQVKKLSEHAIPPARANAGAAGYDLCRCAGTHDSVARAREHGPLPPFFREKEHSAPHAQPLRSRSTRRSALFCSAYDGVVPARGKALLKTDLAIVVPEGTYGRVGELRRGEREPSCK